MGSAMEWNESVAVGIAAFDEDHRQLIEQANALVTACEEGQPLVTQQGYLDDFIELAVYHFEREEQQMREVDFPPYALHKAQHDLLIRTILKFKADLRYGRVAGDEAAEIITDWLLRHIREMDQGYTDYFQARGIR